MISLERHGRCRGVRVRFFSRQIELWFCPKWFLIKPHIHQSIDSFIIQLWGRAIWTVKNTSREVLGPFRKRESTGELAWAAAEIPAGVKHSALTKSFCVFLNIERCHGEHVSASEDFIPA